MSVNSTVIVSGQYNRCCLNVLRNINVYTYTFLVWVNIWWGGGWRTCPGRGGGSWTGRRMGRLTGDGLGLGGGPHVWVREALNYLFNNTIQMFFFTFLGGKKANMSQPCNYRSHYSVIQKVAK